MMKHLNKYLSLALALVLCLSLAACGESNEDLSLIHIWGGTSARWRCGAGGSWR